jgi:small subunit ribosomal protein S10
MINTFTINIKGFNNYLITKITDQFKENFFKLNFKIQTLPVKKRKFTLLRSPHINKKAREQFELNTYNTQINVNFLKERDSKKKVKKIINFLNQDLNKDITYNILISK